MVGGVLPGTPAVGLLLCAPDSPCITEARWMDENVAEAKALPVLFFTEALADTGDSFVATTEDRKAFEVALAAARLAWETGRVDEAAHQLDEAERAVADLSGTIAQQPLFDLYFLRGAVAILAEDKAAASWLARAAAVAWNRTVVLPAQDGPVATAYRDAQHRIMHAKPGKITLAAAERGATWSLDGVEVGAQGGTFTVLPGTHRLVAYVPGKARAWVSTVDVQPEQLVTLVAAFPPEMAIDSLGDALRVAAAGAELDPLAALVLRVWRDERGVREVRVFYVSGSPLSHVVLRLK